MFKKIIKNEILDILKNDQSNDVIYKTIIEKLMSDNLIKKIKESINNNFQLNNNLDDLVIPKINLEFALDKSKVDKNGNIYCAINDDFTAEYFPHLDGLNINFLGKNSFIVIFGKPIFTNSKITVKDNSLVIIKETRRKITNLSILSRFFPVKVYIGSGFSCAGCQLIMDESSNIYIGKECLFSYGIEIRTSDGHSIIKNSNVINSAKDVYIGNHVWLGQGVTILKGTYISDNSIIGTKSVVTNKFYSPGLIIAGIPAKIIKNEVNWSHQNPGVIVKSVKK